MRLLVDGSNVLGSKGELGELGSAERLLWTIERFCGRRSHQALVVFDGMEGRSPGSNFKFSERVWVKVAPPGTGSDRADRVLLQELRSRRGSEPTLVTSDTGLAVLASRLGAVVLDARAFTGMLRDAPRGDEKEAAADGIDNAELLRLWTESREDSG